MTEEIKTTVIWEKDLAKANVTISHLTNNLAEALENVRKLRDALDQITKLIGQEGTQGAWKVAAKALTETQGRTDA